MDIVVTIPKNEYKNDDKETQDMRERNLHQFWTLSRKPKSLKLGDRVYFVKNNVVESSMRVVEITINTETECQTTGRYWAGKCQLFMDDLQIGPNIEIRGFQGFRYRWW